MMLSIVIPVFQAEEYLRTCLDSVSRCTSQEMECILIDDGSRDGSSDICLYYCARDPRFLYEKTANQGVSSARNRGLELAQGDFIMFLDADDYLTEDAWEQIEQLFVGREYDFTAFSYLTHWEDGRDVEQRYSIATDVSTKLDDARQLIYASSEMNTCWGKIYRKAIIDQYQIRFRNELPIGEDYLFVADYFGYCRSSRVINRPILHYVQRADSAMHRYDMAERLGYMEILYRYNASKIELPENQFLTNAFDRYYVRVLTNLLLIFAHGHSLSELHQMYQQALGQSVVTDILMRAENIEMEPFYKKVELYWMQHHRIRLLTWYYKCKARVSWNR